MDTLTRKYKPAKFPAGALKQSNDALLRLLEGDGWKVNISGEYTAANGLTTRKSLGAGDLEQITSLHDSLQMLSFDCIRNDQLVSLVSLQGTSDQLKLVTSATDSKRCLQLSDLFANELALEDLPDEFISAPSTVPDRTESRPSSPPSVKTNVMPTLPWLLQNMPASGWICLSGLLLVAFLLGLMIGKA